MHKQFLCWKIITVAYRYRYIFLKCIVSSIDEMYLYCIVNVMLDTTYAVKRDEMYKKKYESMLLS